MMKSSYSEHTVTMELQKVGEPIKETLAATDDDNSMHVASTTIDVPAQESLSMEREF